MLYHASKSISNESLETLQYKKAEHTSEYLISKSLLNLKIIINCKRGKYFDLKKILHVKNQTNTSLRKA